MQITPIGVPLDGVTKLNSLGQARLLCACLTLPERSTFPLYSSVGIHVADSRYGTRQQVGKTTASAPAKRTMSASARGKIAAAQKAR
jgi:hypothetical protein